MDKVYYKNPYETSLDCTVLKVTKLNDRTEVLLDKTLCYPECGGQPGDRGKLDDWAIIDTQKADDGDSIHILEKDCTLKEGQAVKLTIDWDHRHKYMVMHTCQHLLSGLLYNILNIGTVAVHLGEDYLTIETNRREISEKETEILIKEANRAIVEGHSIKYHEMSHSQAESLNMRRSIKVDGDVRVVEIEGLDKIACGGVHASSTSEIRLVYCYAREQIRGHVRLFFKCAEDAVNAFEKDRQLLSDISDKLTCSHEEAVRKLETILSDYADTKTKLKMLEEKSAQIELNENIKDNVATFETNLDLSAFVQASKAYNDLALCLVSSNKWLIILKGKYSSVDFNSLRQSLLPIIEGKGGGRVPVFQGIGNKTDKASIKAFQQAFTNLL